MRKFDEWLASKISIRTDYFIVKEFISLLFFTKKVFALPNIVSKFLFRCYQLYIFH